MELIFSFAFSCLLLYAVYIGWRMGRGESPAVDLRKMKVAVRSDAQEAKLIEKIQRGVIK